MKYMHYITIEMDGQLCAHQLSILMGLLEMCTFHGLPWHFCTQWNVELHRHIQFTWWIHDIPIVCLLSSRFRFPKARFIELVRQCEDCTCYLQNGKNCLSCLSVKTKTSKSVCRLLNVNPRLRSRGCQKPGEQWVWVEHWLLAAAIWLAVSRPFPSVFRSTNY